MVSDLPYTDADRPPHPLDYISEDAIQDLWGIGYTIVKRAGGDPFNVPPEMVPHTRSYQWWHLIHDKFHFHREGDGTSGWAPVPASRHDGYFMPFGHVGNIEIQGLGLFEKSKIEVNQDLAANTAAAHKLTTDWIERHGGMLSGAVNVGGVELPVGDDALAKQVAGTSGDIYATSKSKTIETTVKIPKEMIPHMAAIFAEIDYLAKSYYHESRNEESEFSTLTLAHIDTKFQAAMDKNQLGCQWPLLHAIVLPIAIENVRKTLKEETKS